MAWLPKFLISFPAISSYLRELPFVTNFEMTELIMHFEQGIGTQESKENSADAARISSCLMS
jgi:hypothetical protein